MHLDRFTAELSLQINSQRTISSETYFLTHLTDDEQKESENRKLVLEVSIWDYEGEWRQKSYAALRDAALSGNRFCHFRIETETIEHSDVLIQLREQGYGPTIKVREFSMWPTISLPKAPEWGWKE
jgi:hypothetical protein